MRFEWVPETELGRDWHLKSHETAWVCYEGDGTWCATGSLKDTLHQFRSLKGAAEYVEGYQSRDL